MRALLAALLLAGCVAPRQACSGPTYTRASLAGLSMAEVAALFLAPADAARIEYHRIREPFSLGGTLSGVHFFSRPFLLAEDICARDVFHAGFVALDPDQSRDLPTRFDRTRQYRQIALARNCTLPRGERRFIDVGYRGVFDQPELTLDDGIAILRRLVAAQSAAAGAGALPFRIACGPVDRNDNPGCRSNPRALLARLPIHQALTIDRAPFRTNTLCGSPRPETGHSVEIAEEGRSGYVWEVRLRDMGTPDAEIGFRWALERDRTRC